MDRTALETIKSFDEDSLPDLDVVTLAALELFTKTKLPTLNLGRFRRPLVLGSGNAIATAKILFAEREAFFADESNYETALFQPVDGAYIFSASGSKHAVTFARALQQRGIFTVLVTNNPRPPAAQEVGGIETLVFPKNREPYTYNTSTYMGMFLAMTKEDPKAIHSFITEHVASVTPADIGDYDAYYLLLPEQFAAMSEMFVTKFDELFGSKVIGRVYTQEQTKHAKTVVANDRELFISFGHENTKFGQHRLHVPFPEEASAATMMAVAYYVIGQIQKNKQPYFKDSIARYMEEASRLFGDELTVIVE